MPTVRANGIDIAYDDQGSGDTPVVLLHGFPLDKSMWEAQVQALCGEFRVITPDLRGHGESQVTPGPYTMELLADDLTGFLDALDIQQVTLGGFSMGGYVAFAFYRKNPERVSCLMLLDTRPQPDSDDAKKGREDMAQLAEREGAGPIAERLTPWLLSPDTVANRQDVVDTLSAMITRCPVEGIAGDLRGMALRSDSSDLLPNIRRANPASGRRPRRHHAAGGVSQHGLHNTQRHTGGGLRRGPPVQPGEPGRVQPSPRRFPARIARSSASRPAVDGCQSQGMQSTA